MKLPSAPNFDYVNCRRGLMIALVLAISPQVMANCLPLPTDMVAWWRAESDALDFMGLNHGVLSGNTTFGPGTNGSAFEFDGNGDLVVVGNPTSLQLQDFTVEAWVKRSDPSLASFGSGGVGVLFGYGDGGYSLYMDGSGLLYFARLGQGAITSTAVVTGTDFHHVALTKNGGSVVFYVDGVAHAGPSYNPGFVFTTDAAIGARGDNFDNSFLGRIDELSVYSRALSAAEIQAIHAAGDAGKCSIPSAPFIFVQPIGQTVSAGENTFFSVLASGTPPLTYQWRFEGTNIDGATDKELVLLAVKISDSGTYSVAVSNNADGVISSNAVLTVNPPPPCAALPLGLVSWWAFEGNADDGVNQNHGILVNTTFVPGKRGQALGFDGNSSQVTVPASPSVNVGTNAGLTFECWIKPNDLTTPQPVAEWNDGTSLGTHFWISVSYAGQGGPGSLFANLIDIGGGTHAFVSAPGVLNINTFHHVAVTYDKASGLGVLYLNGNAVVTANLGTFTPRTGFDLHLGQRQSGLPSAAAYGGSMDEMNLYNRALTSAEVQAIFSAAGTGKCMMPTTPFIFTQPTNQTVAAGTNATFSVVAGGTPDLDYQWTFNGDVILGATHSSLTLSNVGANHAGLYGVTLTNLQGAVDSSNAVLTVLVFPPSLLLQPTNQTRAIGETATLAVTASGTAPLGYQWSFNDTALPAETNALLILPNVGTNQIGVYAVTVTNLYGSETSSNATLAVVFLATNLLDDFDPGIDFPQWSSFGGTVQATNHGGFVSPSNSLWFGGAGSRFAVTRSINTTNGWDLRFQLHFPSGVSPLWDRPELPNDGIVLEYSTNAGVNWIEFGRYNTLTFTNWTPVSALIPERARVPAAQFRWRQLANSGMLSDHWALDDVFLTAIVTTPKILTQPFSQTVNAGATALFNATVDGSLPLGYQWRLNGNDIFGGTNSTFTLTNVQPSQAGNYSLRVANVAGSTVSSNVALKVLVLSAFGNGQPLTNSTHYFSGSVSVELTNLFPGGLVFYTLDGSMPSFLSSQYSGPFPVSQSVILRAIGYRADFLESGELDPVSVLVVPAFSLTAFSAGGGSVIMNPSGNSYPSNTVVHLTAMPNSGWSFLGWLADASGPVQSTNITMNRDKIVRAVFGTTLNTTAAGGGVLLNPPGGVYAYGSVVQLSAVPTTGNQFGIWGNAASGNSNPLFVTITNANPTVSALFGPVGDGQAALTIVPVGRGQIAVNPRANAYLTGSGVTITATPDAGQSFTGWSGDASGTENPLQITLTSSKLIYGNFTRRPRLSGEILRDDGFRFTLHTDHAAVYRLEFSTNLTEWVTLTDITNAIGTTQLFDSANSTGRFYRALILSQP